MSVSQSSGGERACCFQIVAIMNSAAEGLVQSSRAGEHTSPTEHAARSGNAVSLDSVQVQL